MGVLVKDLKINGFPKGLNAIVSIFQTITIEENKVKFPDHHQGIICGVALDRFSLRRINPYASVVAPWRLASNTLLVVRNPSKLLISVRGEEFDGGFGNGP